MDLVLTEIETQVAANNARIHARMVKANSGKSKVFHNGDIATLKIPLKLRLKTEAVRLPVRVLEYKDGQYKLQCRHGRLAGRYQGMHIPLLLPFLKLTLLGGELNVVDNASIEILGSAIRIEPKMQGNKEVTISFANAVARDNNRGSFTAAQKAGRRAPKARATKTRAVTRAKGKGRDKGKGRATEAIDEDEEVREVEVVDNTSTIASEVLSGSRGRKRKAVDIDAGTGPSETASGMRKLRKRA
jgi:hypothetical protein